MVFLQNKLNLKVSQKQILTPGLVQMVSVLALNKLELKDMITEEMVANPVLDELESSIPLLDEVSKKEESRERESAASAEQPSEVTAEEKDPFDEIDFGSFFRDYLDPGHRTHFDIESLEAPSFENFLSKPTTLSDHLMWQLGSLTLEPEVREAAELIVGNLNEDGYLTASEGELLGVGHAEPDEAGEPQDQSSEAVFEAATSDGPHALHLVSRAEAAFDGAELNGGAAPAVAIEQHVRMRAPSLRAVMDREVLEEGLRVVHTLDPIGVAARDLRECLLLQLEHHRSLYPKRPNGNGELQVMDDAVAIVDGHLHALQNKQYREIGRSIGRPVEAVMRAFEYIKTLDPRPGAAYNRSEPRLIEPDVYFVKQGEDWMVVMNEDDLPQLRLNPAYKKLLTRDGAEKDVRNYVKERYKSAIQLIKNIEQRKQTISKVCHAIIERQRDFLEHGIDHLRPMMIKDVAEEIGVHPSTVSRAVASKYAHTPQGVRELRFFFTESVQGPEGGGTSLLILKRRVKKLIDEEDPAKPLTDDHITRVLQSQGIQVTRRTVAKYREDMKIPSTHQRRVKK
jgi:RNA polymerase sigma-54 factor